MPKDFSGQNLRGRTFKDKNLEGANFSGADIRGADFTGANLRGANFSHAIAGLQKRWAIFLVLVSSVLMSLSGSVSTLGNSIILDALIVKTDNNALSLFNKNYEQLFQVISENIKILSPIMGWTILVILVILFFVTIRQGIQAGLGAFALAVFGVVALTVAFAVAFAVALVFLRAFNVAVTYNGFLTVAGFFTIAGALTGAGGFMGTLAFLGAVVEAVTGTFAGAVAGIGGVIVGGVVVVGFETVIFGGKGSTTAGVVAVVLFSAYISWRALKGDSKYALIHNIAIAFAAFKGTSFRSADLTNANFTEATLKSTDFREANLTRTCFSKTKKLDRVRPGTSYLNNAALRQVLITGEGKQQNFDQQNLRGVNLQAANLQNTSFIATDLSEANLQDADLSKAKLVQTQLDQTDLTGATLTGAYIEEWNISTDTKLHGVKCDYVFMRLPPEKRPDFLALPPEERLDDNPRRKPDDWNKNFIDGEFADFIAPLVQTLDLYHNKVVDPRFIAIAFQQLQEAHPEAELEITSIEKKGKKRDKIHIKAETSPDADTSTLHADYFTNLEYLQSLSPAAQQALVLDRGAMLKLLAGLFVSGSTPHPVSIVNNNFQNQENENQNESRNINMGDGNYNENIKGNYVEGDSANIVESSIPVLNQIKCNKCGYNNPDINNFCNHCGEKF